MCRLRLEELVLAAEDRRDGVVGEDIHDRLGEELRDREHGHVRRHLHRVDRHGVGDDDAVDRRVKELLQGAVAEDAVRVIAELCANAEARALLAGDDRKLSERLSASVPAIMLALTEPIRPARRLPTMASYQ